MAVSASYELRFDAGRVCLDLVATVGGRLGDEPVERLDGPGRLGQWLLGAGLLPPGVRLDAVDAGWLARFHALWDLAGPRRVRRTRRAGHRRRRGPGQRAGQRRAAGRAGGSGRGRHPGAYARRPPRLRRAARPDRQGRGGPAHRPTGARAVAPLRGGGVRGDLPGTPRAAGAAVGAPARCAATGSGWPATADARWPPAADHAGRASCARRSRTFLMCHQLMHAQKELM